MQSEFNQLYEETRKTVYFHRADYWLCILTKYQKLLIAQDNKILQTYGISTAEKGVGCLQDSLKTPNGLHQIIEKIGNQSKKYQIFKVRQAIENLATIEYGKISTGKDLITSRILRLSGLEYNKNYGDNVDSFNRYIYIHGTNEEGLIGQAVSHGCIRMKNEDIINLFSKISVRTLVNII